MHINKETGSITPEQIYRPEPHGSILTTHEFYQDWAHLALKVQNGRVFTQAMVFFPDEAGRTVTDIFKKVPAGNKKEVVIDAYSHLAMMSSVAFLDQFTPGRRGLIRGKIEEYRALIEELRKDGANVREINPANSIVQKVFPVLGRDHTKATYVTGENVPPTFYLHTNNHEEEDRINMALKLTGNPALRMIEEFDHMRQNPSRKDDYSVEIVDGMELFVDGGTPGKSIILDKATELVKGAQKSVKTITLMRPGGQFGNALDHKHRELAGKKKPDIDILISKSEWEWWPPYGVYNMFWAIQFASDMEAIARRSPLQISHDTNREAHAKFLLVDDEILFLGSHNYVESGVKAGTREAQLLVRDRNIVQEAVRTFRDAQILARATNEGTTEAWLTHPPVR